MSVVLLGPVTCATSSGTRTSPRQRASATSRRLTPTRLPLQSCLDLKKQLLASLVKKLRQLDEAGVDVESFFELMVGNEDVLKCLQEFGEDLNLPTRAPTGAGEAASGADETPLAEHPK